MSIKSLATILAFISATLFPTHGNARTSSELSGSSTLFVLCEFPDPAEENPACIKIEDQWQECVEDGADCDDYNKTHLLLLARRLESNLVTEIAMDILDEFDQWSKEWPDRFEKLVRKNNYIIAARVLNLVDSGHEIRKNAIVVPNSLDKFLRFVHSNTDFDESVLNISGRTEPMSCRIWNGPDSLVLMKNNRFRLGIFQILLKGLDEDVNHAWCAVNFIETSWESFSDVQRQRFRDWLAGGLERATLRDAEGSIGGVDPWVLSVAASWPGMERDATIAERLIEASSEFIDLPAEHPLRGAAVERGLLFRKLPSGEQGTFYFSVSDEDVLGSIRNWTQLAPFLTRGELRQLLGEIERLDLSDSLSDISHEELAEFRLGLSRNLAYMQDSTLKFRLLKVLRRHGFLLSKAELSEVYSDLTNLQKLAFSAIFPDNVNVDSVSGLVEGNWEDQKDWTKQAFVWNALGFCGGELPAERSLSSLSETIDMSADSLRECERSGALKDFRVEGSE